MFRRNLVCVAIVFATGCAGSIDSRPTEINGASVYADNCNRCHEYRSPTEFNGPQWSIITTHMRVVGGIPADESRAVFEYLKSQHHPPYVAANVREDRVATPADASRGQSLVQGRGCIGCHVVEGQGGVMGPRLDGIAGRRSEAFVLQQLRDPQANSPGSLMPNLGLTPEDADAIWAYLQTLDNAGGT